MCSYLDHGILWVKFNTLGLYFQYRTYSNKKKMYHINMTHMQNNDKFIRFLLDKCTGNIIKLFYFLSFLRNPLGRRAFCGIFASKKLCTACLRRKRGPKVPIKAN